MTVTNSHITILTLNVNELNTPTKRHRLANCIKDQNPLVCCIQETHFTCKHTHRLKKRDGGRFTKQMGRKKKARVAILVSDTIDFKPTKIKKDKEEPYIMVKGSMQQEELTILKYMHPIHKASS